MAGRTGRKSPPRGETLPLKGLSLWLFKRIAVSWQVPESIKDRYGRRGSAIFHYQAMRIVRSRIFAVLAAVIVGIALAFLSGGMALLVLMLMGVVVYGLFPTKGSVEREAAELTVKALEELRRAEPYYAPRFGHPRPIKKF